MNQTQPNQIWTALVLCVEENTEEQVTGADVTHSVLDLTRAGNFITSRSCPTSPTTWGGQERPVAFNILHLSDTWSDQSVQLSPSRPTASTEQTQRTHCVSSKTMETVLHEKPRRDRRSTDQCVQWSKRSPANGKLPRGTDRRSALVALKRRAAPSVYGPGPRCEWSSDQSQTPLAYRGQVISAQAQRGLLSGRECCSFGSSTPCATAFIPTGGPIWPHFYQMRRKDHFLTEISHSEVHYMRNSGYCYGIYAIKWLFLNVIVVVGTFYQHFI